MLVAVEEVVQFVDIEGTAVEDRAALVTALRNVFANWNADVEYKH